jgi:hypothetical protein
LESIEIRRAVRDLNQRFGAGNWGFCVSTSYKDNSIVGTLAAPGLQFRHELNLQGSFKDGENPVAKCFLACVDQLMKTGGEVLEQSSQGA